MDDFVVNYGSVMSMTRTTAQDAGMRNAHSV